MENYNNNIPYHLILGEIDQSLTKDESDELENWKNSSPGNMDIYNSLRNIDEDLDLLSVYQKVDSVEAWNKNKASIITSGNKKRLYIWAGSIAAASLLAISVITFNLRNATIYETAANETRHIILPDGSSIFLNKNSKISFPKSAFNQKRAVKLLKGEAFFSVVHDAERAFTVELGNVIVRDIGTSFDLKMDDDHIQTIVSSGAVSMEYRQPGVLHKNNTEKLILKANQMGVLDLQTKKITTDTAIPSNYKAWQDNKLRYDQTPLDTVLADLNRLYGMEVMLPDSSLKNKKLTAFFNNRSKEQIMQIIAVSLQLKLEVVKKDSIFRLSQ